MAEEVKSYRFSRRFKKGYQRLPKEIQEAFDQKLPVFLRDMSRPSLRVKPLQGTKGRWEGSITMKYRFTFEFSQDTLIFRAKGGADGTDQSKFNP